MMILCILPLTNSRSRRTIRSLACCCSLGLIEIIIGIIFIDLTFCSLNILPLTNSDSRWAIRWRRCWGRFDLSRLSFSWNCPNLERKIFGYILGHEIVGINVELFSLTTPSIILNVWVWLTCVPSHGMSGGWPRRRWREEPRQRPSSSSRYSFITGWG